MFIIFMAALFGGISLLAILAFMTGESLRATQREAVDRYVARRTEVLTVLRNRKRQAELEKQRQAEEEQAKRQGILGSKGPADERLDENIAFVARIATEAPQIFATVMKHYVRLDPAVRSGLKCASELTATQIPPRANDSE